METLPQRPAQGEHAPQARDPLRQVPRHAPPWRGARRGPQDGIRPAVGQGPAFIKGQRYTLLSNRENLTTEGKQSLEAALAANKRLNTAYLLKESFDQLWNYRATLGRRFFDNWKRQPRSGNGSSPMKFADMVDRHWDGIAAYCQPENKVALGFVEGLNNKIRVIQRRAYGLHDEEYLRLKVLARMLPVL